MSRNKPRVASLDFNRNTIEDDVKSIIRQQGWTEHIKSDSAVFVKPNFTLPFFKPGVTTHRIVLEAVLGALKDRASAVYVGESDGGYGSYTADYALLNHNVPEMCARTGAVLVNLSKSERITVRERINGRDTEVVLPKILTKVDESISVPVLKVHAVTGVSLSLKNMWGCHPDTLRLLDHKHLSERLTLIAKSVNLRHVIVDAIYGLDYNGPMVGYPVRVNALLFGDNPVATDATATRLMGFNPLKIHHLSVAARSGLGPINVEDIDVAPGLSRHQQHFTVNPGLVDMLGALTFKSKLLSRLVFASPMTETIYSVLGRKPGKTINEPGDEE